MKLWPLTRRSAFLVLFGIAFSVIGYSYIRGPAAPNLQEQLHLALAVVPLWFFGAVWLVCGLVAIATGITRWQKPLGFAALTFIATMWGGCYFAGWLAGDAPVGYRTAVVFWVIAGAVHIVAGMVESR